MFENLIQLINGTTIIVNDKEFKRVLRSYKRVFSFSNFLTILDIQGHLFTIKKENVLFFEDYNGQKIKKT